MLRSVQDLEKMRQQVRADLAARESAGGARVVVAMGTCGIAAGAREVVTALMNELEQRGLTDITITQCGCKGLCDREPTMDVLRPGEPSVTYGDVTPERARRIIADHVIGGRVIDELVLFMGDSQGPKA